MQVSGVSIQKEQKIASLQALRAFAFLGIFLEHAKFAYRWPTLGVSVFFVMSGFLMTYRYENAELSTLPKDCLFFSLNKIKKLYPLHIITMLCAAALPALKILRSSFSLRSTLDLGIKLILHSTLLQTWVPYWTISSSLNEVAWFLSVTMFLYFIFPWLKKVVEQHSITSLLVISGLILLAEVIVCIPLLAVLGSRSQVYIWFMYNFPCFRMGDFFIGCVLKRVYFECSTKKIGTLKASVLELLATALTVLTFFWCAAEHSNLVLKALSNWTTPYIPLAAVWVMLFAANKGLLTRMLSNRITIAVGNISAYAFLIHFIITTYTRYLLSGMDIAVSGWRSILIVFAELIISIVLSVLYKRFEEKYISPRFYARAHAR